MRYQNAPKTLPHLVSLRQLRPFGVGDAQRRQGSRTGGCAAAIDVQVGHTVRDAQDLDNATVRSIVPDIGGTVVGTERHCDTDREIEKVLDIERKWLAEVDFSRAGSDGLVGV